VLDALFVSKSRIEVLRHLLLDSRGRFYLRELAAAAAVPLRSAQIELKRLTDAGVLLREVSGRQTYYRINDLCPIVPELRSMFVKTIGVGDALRGALAPLAGDITAAFIYGSFARGDVRVESDIDLFVVGNVSLRGVVSALKEVNVGRVINPTVMSLAELQERLAAGDHFVSTLVASPKVFVVGDENGLTGSH
jgi:DNA-binding transcriptional ArsR family regulator